jgi:hypothetical protein
VSAAEVTGGAPTDATCPSGRCREGAQLIGIVGHDGILGYISPAMTIDSEFVSRAQAGRAPESRFRFAEPCVEERCHQWDTDRCGLVDQILASPAAPAIAAKRVDLLPRCAIRRACRWFSQRGPAACALCPVIVNTPRVPAACGVTQETQAGERAGAGRTA